MRFYIYADGVCLKVAESTRRRRAEREAREISRTYGVDASVSPNAPNSTPIFERSVSVNTAQISA